MHVCIYTYIYVYMCVSVGIHMHQATDTHYDEFSEGKSMPKCWNMKCI